MRPCEMYEVTFRYFFDGVLYTGLSCVVSPWTAALLCRRGYYCGAQSSDKTDSLYNHCKPTSKIISNKSTNQMHQSLRFISRRSNTAQHVSDILLPIIRSL